MKINLSLIAMPWSDPFSPSSQLGALKAHVDRAFQGKIKVTSHSAHLGILYRWKGSETLLYYRNFGKNGEYPYLYLLYKNFLRQPKGKDRVPLKNIIEAVNKRLNPFVKFEDSSEPMTTKLLNSLETATHEFADKEIIPRLSSSELNVIGFTLNFYQLYASAYMERYIRRRARGKKLLFVYGGYSANAPVGLQMLKNLGATGFRVVGEGERKLEAVLRALEDMDECAPTRIKLAIEGVVPISKDVDPFERKEENFLSQFEKMDDLALPDFGEYYTKAQKIRKSDFIVAKYNRFAMLVEGSRGCFARCDFCTLNSQWKGFRKFSADSVFERTVTLIEIYRNNRIYFLDNVCDTWAEAFADLVIDKEKKLTFFMELRAHHPESFWTKLALAGLERVQIGIEAISEPLLRKIGKGTHVIQNLKTQKYLAELGVHSGSNIITHHPKSTVADVIETKRVLELTPHFPRLCFVTFWFDAQSPMFNSLSREEKYSLLPFKAIEFGGDLQHFSAEFGFNLPPSLELSPEVRQAWDNLVRWNHDEYMGKACRGSLTSRRVNDREIGLRDTRYGREREFILRGHEAGLYDFCHRGATRLGLEKLGIPQMELQRAMDKFLTDELLIESSDTLLSLALRPREELIDRLRDEKRTPERVSEGLLPSAREPAW